MMPYDRMKNLIIEVIKKNKSKIKSKNNTTKDDISKIINFEDINIQGKIRLSAPILFKDLMRILNTNIILNKKMSQRCFKGSIFNESDINPNNNENNKNALRNEDKKKDKSSHLVHFVILHKGNQLDVVEKEVSELIPSFINKTKGEIHCAFEKIPDKITEYFFKFDKRNNHPSFGSVKKTFIKFSNTRLACKRCKGKGHVEKNCSSLK
eukprot:TRINITY_DN1999_c0_g2_i1.p1 TRINITY_DN1999_c0_g2~~TRINITY_DN1999_c0_g2_i1.p1  ORF type:complete len:209 (-),score=49.01 TRINITY_DN1999_c0_g2_i1:496-1122(-)